MVVQMRALARCASKTEALAASYTESATILSLRGQAHIDLLAGSESALAAISVVAFAQDAK